MPSHHDLVERVLDDALSPGGLETWNQIADRPFLDDRIDGHPLVIAERRDRRPLERRQQREHGIEIPAPDIQHDSDTALSFNRGLQQKRDVLELRPLPEITKRCWVS